MVLLRLRIKYLTHAWTVRFNKCVWFIKVGEMLTSALRVLVKIPIKESLYGKKKSINILIVFFISHKSDVKTFLK